MDDVSDGRSCQGCGRPLSRYNPQNRCQSCADSIKRERPQSELAIGNRLAGLRYERGMTQRILADRAGLSLSLIQKFEQNARKWARADTISALAQALNTTVNDLIGQDDSARGMQPGGLTESPPADITAPEDANAVMGRIRKLIKGTLDSADIDMMRGSAQDTIARYEGLDHGPLVPALQEQRFRLESLLAECTHPGQ